MIDLNTRINAFAELGKVLGAVSEEDFIAASLPEQVIDNAMILNQWIAGSVNYNGWFTEDMVRYMLRSLADSLKPEYLDQWLESYFPEIAETRKPKTIGVVMAGNVPAVGFHDFLTVLISGNKLLAKLSSDDNKLLPAIAGILTAIEPGFDDMIGFTDGRLEGFDAIIATGSNNTSRYFDYYFGKYPNIIRKNRNGVAVLSGTETEDDLKNLADDIFLYYGLGCRNVSKLFVPEGYDFEPLLKILSGRKDIEVNHKYFNNYEYNKAIYLVNGTPHFDTGNVLLVEDTRYSSPVSVVFYETYSSVQALEERFKTEHESIQCIVSNIPGLSGKVDPGQSQQPRLWDYADGKDSLRFALSLE